MKTAKEMFEELGYRQTDKLPTYIEYLKEVLINLKIIRNDLEYKYKIDNVIESLLELIKEESGE